MDQSSAHTLDFGAYNAQGLQGRVLHNHPNSEQVHCFVQFYEQVNANLLTEFIHRGNTKKANS